MRDGQGATPVTQVLIADQIAHIVEHLEKLADFADTVQVCGIAREPTEVVDEARARQPDVVLLGTGMTDTDTHDLVKQLAGVAPHTRILSLTANGAGNGTGHGTGQATAPEYGVVAVAQSLSGPELVAAIRGAAAAATSVRELDTIAATPAASPLPAGTAAPAAAPESVSAPAPAVAPESVSAPAPATVPVPATAPPSPPAMPPAPEPIRDVVPRPPRTPGQARGEVIVVHSGKGGVGKSMLASNIAVALAVEAGSKVALVDLDLQYGDAGVMLHIDAHPPTIEAFATDTVDQDALHRVMATGPAGVRVLLAPTSPDRAERVARTTVRSILQELRTTYDHIVVDTPAHLDAIVLDTIQTADVVLLVTTFNVTTVKSARSTLRLMRTLGVDSDRIVLILNQMRPRLTVARAEVEEVLRYRMLTQLPYEPHVDDAVDTGRPLILSQPRSPMSRQLTEIVRYLVPSATPDAPVSVEPPEHPHVPAPLRRFALSRRWLKTSS